VARSKSKRTSIPKAPRSRRRAVKRAVAPYYEVIEEADASLLELVDNLLNRGVVVSGEAIIGVANVDLVYLRLAAVLCASDRLFPAPRTAAPRS
jgi:hypothetical protein